MSRYYRIQPAGLGLDHDSESSEGAAPGLDVFGRAFHLYRLDAPRRFYGDEVLVIEGGESWENGDVEGVRIDGRTARIVARLSCADLDARVRVALGLDADDEIRVDGEDDDALARAFD